MGRQTGIQKMCGKIWDAATAILCVPGSTKQHWYQELLKQIGAVAIVCIAAGIGTQPHSATAAGLVLEADSVKVGKQISFAGNTEKYSFKSGDEQIAYVSEEGVITGKKQGNVTIVAEKPGNKKKFDVTVKANGNKPAIKVCTDELTIKEPELFMEDGGNYLAITIKNNSKQGTVKKVKCTFLCTVVCGSTSQEPGEGTEDEEDMEETIGEEASGDTEDDISVGNGEGIEDGIAADEDNTYSGMVTMEKTVSVSFGKIWPKSEEFVFYEKINNLIEIQEAELQSVVLYSGEAKLKEDFFTGDMAYGWGTEDTIAPVITGFVGNKGCNGSDRYVVLYEDNKTAYKKYVAANDDRDGKVAVKADFSQVDWSKTKNYTITLTATDKAGNQAKKKIKVQVRRLAGVDLYADRILNKITSPGQSNKAKCKAIYSYVQSHMSYVNYNGGSSWESAALRGLRYGNGNCYAFYSLSRLLLTRAGIPNIMVTRYPAVPNHHHWWNLVYVDGGWYHFDTTPRRLRGRFCLLTDAQLQVYERRSPGTYRYAGSSYPKRAAKVICAGPF